MLSYPAKVVLKVIASLFEIISTCCAIFFHSARIEESFINISCDYYFFLTQNSKCMLIINFAYHLQSLSFSFLHASIQASIFGTHSNVSHFINGEEKSFFYSLIEWYSECYMNVSYQLLL